MKNTRKSNMNTNMTYLVFVVISLFCHIPTSESPVIRSRRADSRWPLAPPLAQPVVQGQFCPPHIADTHCDCAEKGLRVYVDCRNMGMSDVPDVFPPNTYQLDLSGNLLEKLSFNDLRSLPLLVEFICYDCQLNDMHPKSFSYNKKLQQIILNNNNLKHIDINMFTNLPDLRFVDLSNNPLNRSCISELQKKYPQVEFKFSVDLYNSSSTENNLIETSTEIVETTAWDTNLSVTRTSQNTAENPLGSTSSEYSKSQPNTPVLTPTDKSKTNDNASTEIICVVIVVIVGLGVGAVYCMKWKGQVIQQRRQETEQELHGANTGTIINSAAHLLDPDQEDKAT